MLALGETEKIAPQGAAVVVVALLIKMILLSHQGLVLVILSALVGLAMLLGFRALESLEPRQGRTQPLDQGHQAERMRLGMAAVAAGLAPMVTPLLTRVAVAVALPDIQGMEEMGLTVTEQTMAGQVLAAQLREGRKVAAAAVLA